MDLSHFYFSVMVVCKSIRKPQNLGHWDTHAESHGIILGDHEGLLSNWEGKWRELLPHLPNTREVAQEKPREPAVISEELGFRQTLVSLINSCATSAKLLNLSEPLSSSLKN